MARYPIKMLKDENNNPFVPLVSTECVKDPGGQSLDQKLANKLESNNIQAGDNTINVSTSGNNVSITANLPGEEYSTNETRIGTWIDGKNVYRRTIKTTAANAANTLKSLGIIENLKEIIMHTISYTDKNNIKYLTDNPSEAPIIFIEASNKIDESHKSDYFNNCLITITLIYTKTTD